MTVYSNNWYDQLGPDDYDDFEDERNSEMQDALLNIMNMLYCSKSKFNEDDLLKNLLLLAKWTELKNIRLEFDDIQVTSKKKHEWEVYNKAIEAKESKEFITRHIKVLHSEIYGDEPLDYFNVAGSMANLLWHCGVEDVKTPKKMNIQRKV